MAPSDEPDAGEQPSDDACLRIGVRARRVLGDQHEAASADGDEREGPQAQVPLRAVALPTLGLSV